MDTDHHLGLHDDGTLPIPSNQVYNHTTNKDLNVESTVHEAESL